MLRTSNPALGEKTFSLRAAQGEESMTIQGTKRDFSTKC